MMETKAFRERYLTILRQFLGNEQELALYASSELGKQLVLSKAGPDVLIELHAESLKSLIKDADPMVVTRTFINANELLLNGIMAYAMTYYGYMDQLTREKEKLETARKELMEKNRQLEKANEKLQEMDRLKSMFIASMSHELRTPLNSIIGFTGILLQGLAGELNPEQRDQLSRVSRAGKHLLALITDIIDVSKIEAGKVSVYPKPHLLHHLIAECVDDVRHDAQEKGLEISVHVPKDITLVTDRRRLIQAILNYLSNAVKYTPKGSISIHAGPVSMKTGDGIEIHVSDTGIGIAPSDLRLLFNSFVRLENPFKTTTPGTGLGLYLAKKIVTELLKGEVFVHSMLGKGSTFGLKIPKILPAA